MSCLTPLSQQDGFQFSYTSGALENGSHDVTVKANHWATDPAQQLPMKKHGVFMSRNQRGFTFVEALIALAIAMIVSLVIGIFLFPSCA